MGGRLLVEPLQQGQQPVVRGTCATPAKAVAKAEMPCRQVVLLGAGMDARVRFVHVCPDVVQLLVAYVL
eukprot:4457786-Amphidinium_carterae.1